MTRRNFPQAVIAASFLRAEGRCEGKRPDGDRCNAVLVKGRWRCDHIIPDAMGGEPVIENAQCLCPLCDGEKTPQDIANIGLAKRREALDIGGGKQKKAKPKPILTKPPLARRPIYQERT